METQRKDVKNLLYSRRLLMNQIKVMNWAVLSLRVWLLSTSGLQNDLHQQYT